MKKVDVQLSIDNTANLNLKLDYNTNPSGYAGEEKLNTLIVLSGRY